mgnify:CR=1 FL=1
MSEILKDFKEKILSTTFDAGTISEVNGNIEIKTSYAEGKINFYALDVLIVEMSVTNLADDENKFYLHFELRDLNYASELFEEMLSTIIDLKNKQSLKILLSCTGGLTTGFFADKLNETAKMLSLNYEFSAVPFHKLYNVGFDYSVILLAPQIAYQIKTAQEILHDKLVLKIPPKIFASYDAGEMLEFIRAELDNRTKTVEERAILKVRAGLIKSDAKILSIAVMPFANQTRIAYRIYQKGAVLLNETVIKGRIKISHDLQDIMDTASRLGVPFDTAGIAIPGIIQKGHFVFNFYGEVTLDLKGLLEEKYKIPVTISNNANAAALGYYAQQDKFENIVFFTRPRNFTASGLGIVINGKMISGAHNIAGEMQYISREFFTDEDQELWEKNKTVDWKKVPDTIAREIRAAISVTDPELICVRSEMTPDLEKIKTALKKFIPAEYLPEFIYIPDAEMAEYILLGQMILSLEELENKMFNLPAQKLQNVFYLDK